VMEPSGKELVDEALRAAILSPTLAVALFERAIEKDNADAKGMLFQLQCQDIFSSLGAVQWHVKKQNTFCRLPLILPPI
jgi:hypothetical protein